MRRLGKNRYRLRFAKLSEVLPRSERSLALVRMTRELDAETWKEPVPASLREAVRGPSAKRAFARFGQDDTRIGCGDLERTGTGFASRSCPRSFREASVRSLWSG